MKNKEADWLLIKSKAPAIACFLVAISAAFGKPAALKVEFSDGVIVEHGVFDYMRPGLLLRSTMRNRAYGQR